MENIIDNLNKIDDILSSYEDWMHGQDGENVTRCRKYLIEIKNMIS